MTHRFVDTHCHFDFPPFTGNEAQSIAKAAEAGVQAIIVPSVEAAYFTRVLDLSARYSALYAALGLHPIVIERHRDEHLEELDRVLQRAGEKLVAIGEIGLDYHWEDECPREKQKEVFIAQLELAKKHDLPVVIHDREAHGDMMDILRKYKPKGVVHCFSGSAELAQETVKLGMYIGLGGVVTFKNARHSVEVAKTIPLDRLLTETDAPYMAPVPFRGKRCDSSMIPYDAAKIAEVRGITAQEVLETACENACRLFGITLPNAAK